MQSMIRVASTASGLGALGNLARSGRLSDRKSLSSPFLHYPISSTSSPQKISKRPFGAVASAVAKRVYVDYTIYKGKAALCVRPISPSFRRLEEGFAMAREGVLLFEFAPSSGVRQYDWKRKQLFAASIDELGSILSISSRDRLEFFHDPNMGRQDAGKVRKVMSIEPMEDKNGFFFNLAVTDSLQGINERLGLPITTGEFFVLRNSITYLLPHFMGWQAYVDPSSINESMLVDQALPSSPVEEWAKS